ncbi:MAG: molybdopterin molybdotransferase MoeA [Pirellulales bacterium]|nr:molybdopterin molybdotransferase MoeA [Pirellulales bacterium]
MISVDEALQLVLAHADVLPAVEAPLADALGLVLARDVASDLDSPPWDKAMVDGYAVQAADLASGHARLTILEEIVAGAVPTQSVRPGGATRIMTGAPTPDGCDAVVMVEQTSHHPGDGLGQVEINEVARAGQNILRRATALAQGDVALLAGKKLRAIEIGLLAEVGCVQAPVIPRPRVAVLSTGNELIPPSEIPGPGQIRNSNGPMLAAAVRELGASAIELGPARDELADLRQRVAEGLDANILVLSGGVSAGVLDLVPQVLAELGVEQVFHKIKLKPGKPLWFGVRRGRRPCLVFGLPGNPVSSLVCFQLFVRPAMASLAGQQGHGLTRVRARLASGFQHRGDRPTYHPAVFDSAGEAPTIEPLRWQGSADLFGLSLANALAHFPAGDRHYAAGESIEAVLL